MADIYKVIYQCSSGQEGKVVYVSATSLANAIAAAKTNDATLKAVVNSVVLHHNIVSGS